LNPKHSYGRSSEEKLSEGILGRRRPEPTLEQARIELAAAITRISSKLIPDDYGKLTQVISEATIVEVLKSMEANFYQKKGDWTLILEEICERLVQGTNRGAMNK